MAHTRLALAGAICLLALGTGCSTGGDSAEGGSTADTAPAAKNGAELPEPAPGQRDSGGAALLSEADDADGGSDSAESAARVPAQTSLYIRTGRVTLVSDDLNAAREAVDRMVKRYGGQVADERTANDKEGRTQSTELTLRIPADQFATAMASFSDVGAVQSSKTDQDDVTTEVIDVAARIKTQQVSLRRLRGFLGEATNVDAMIRLESEIARREADLGSLQAQQNYLEDQTSLSTINLTMRLTEDEIAPPKEKDSLENAGFLTGLQNGWQALLDVLLVVATIVGALIPFLVLLAVLGVPSWIWLRATRRSRAAAPTPEPAG